MRRSAEPATGAFAPAPTGAFTPAPGRSLFAVLRPLRIPSVALLWAGLATSSVGDQLFAVVLNWAAVGVFGAAAGYLSALQAATTLLAAMTLGAWADRRDHRATMIGADIGRAAILVVVVIAWTSRGTPPAWSLIVCVLALAAGQALFRPALQATVPTLVDHAALLPATNGLLDTTERIARLLGPGLVALASGVLPLVHFVSLDAATFLVSAAAVASIARLRPVERLAASARAPMLDTILRGFRAVRRDRLLSYQLRSNGIVNGAWYAAYFLCAPLVLTRAGSGLASYGMLISAYGSTNLMGTLVVGSFGIARRPERLIFGGNLFLGLGIVLLGVTATLAPPAWLLPLFCACAALSAIGGPMQDITTATLRQTVLPRGDLAAGVRAFMVVNALGMLVTLLGAPAVIGRIDPAGGLLLCGGAALAVGVVGWIRFGAWRSPRAA